MRAPFERFRDDTTRFISQKDLFKISEAMRLFYSFTLDFLGWLKLCAAKKNPFVLILSGQAAIAAQNFERPLKCQIMTLELFQKNSMKNQLRRSNIQS